MPDFALSPAAQHWVLIVLVWTGFGTLAGLLATIVFPMQKPTGPFWTIVLGITGTTVGLLGLEWLFPVKELNPISPVGFLAAAVGALALLVLYRISRAMSDKRDDAEKH
jgi:uncharacterized membrane protein YeaQ/YmgE (transglycosylase-associated protein family)